MPHIFSQFSHLKKKKQKIRNKFQNISSGAERIIAGKRYNHMPNVTQFEENDH